MPALLLIEKARRNQTQRSKQICDLMLTQGSDRSELLLSQVAANVRRTPAGVSHYVKRSVRRGEILGISSNVTYVVPPDYDSMIAKLIVHARTREDAIRRMERALAELAIVAIKPGRRCTSGSWPSGT